MIIPLMGSQTASDSLILKRFTKTRCTKLVLITMFTQAICVCTLCSISLPTPYPQPPLSGFPPPSGNCCLCPRQQIPIFVRIVSQSEQYFLNRIQWGIFFINKDLISRTATKQINCHALRAKKYPASLFLSSSSPYRQHLCDEARKPVTRSHPAIWTAGRFSSTDAPESELKQLCVHI